MVGLSRAPRAGNRGARSSPRACRLSWSRRACRGQRVNNGPSNLLPRDGTGSGAIGGRAWLRPAEGGAKQPHANEYGRNAQELPHVQRERRLERLLGLLEELDCEAGAEDQYKKDASERAGSLAKLGTPLEPEHPGEDHEIGQCLVEHRGMAGVGVHPSKHDGPGHRAWAPDDLRVEEVPDANAGGRDRRGYRHPIQEPQNLLPSAPSEKPNREGDPQRTPMAREATAPDRQD